MNDWRDIKVGVTYRIRNIQCEKLDRTIVSVTEKKLVYQRREVKQGQLSEIDPKEFIHYYNNCGIPYDPQSSMVTVFMEPNIEFDDEEEGQLSLF